LKGKCKGLLCINVSVDPWASLCSPWTPTPHTQFNLKSQYSTVTFKYKNCCPGDSISNDPALDLEFIVPQVKDVEEVIIYYKRYSRQNRHLR
jgi:hypothetical protein